ncbi:MULTISPECIES: hypothetical protein [Bacillales]|jgi:hypothetical protein|uniref:hypothetical protein n=1 Tax=Bacillales TaxID=1385 RepID=UPI000BF2F8EC|nr:MULTISPECIES: hypothetical protein [Bacillaceae]MCA0992420.1 hypothetical protein [Pseudalkalibacillus hwajinpoensis]PFG14233.1 hypothetical protein ATG70_2459 [Bacillus sp. es.036]
MRKLTIITFAVYLCLFTIRAEASTLQNSFSFKCMVVSNGIEHEWEFSSPNEFEVENGNVVEKGERAKKEVEALFQHLEVTEIARVEELVKKMDSFGYQNAERFELKWMDASGRLYTWVWDENDQ